MKTKTILPLILAVFMMAIVIIMPLYFYFNHEMPSQIAFSKALGSKITMLYDAGSIYDFYNRTQEYCLALEQEFTGLDTAKVYADWLPWNQIPENTVAENIRWVRDFEGRCYRNYDEQLAIQNGTIKLMYPFSTWEQSTIQGLRNESKRAGGVAWSVYGAWYQVHQPYVFWLHNALWWFGWFDVAWFICVILAAFSFFFLISLEDF